MQANCAQCHTAEYFKSTPLVAQSRQLFFQKNCYGCHRIEGLSSGTLGPDLSEVGKKFKVDYLWESIVDPRANLKTSFMPKFNLSEGEVKALVTFLKSRRGINFSETSLDRYRATLAGKETKAEKPATTGTTAASNSTALGPTLTAPGEKLLNDKSCLACHKHGPTEGGIAPDLSFEGLIRNEPWLMEHFRDPRARVSDSIMPSFGFPDTDFSAITAYLKSLTKPPAFTSPEELYKNTCARCHGERGDGKGVIAIYLDPYPRDLSKAAFMSSKPDDRFAASIKEGVAGTSMPPWGGVLSDEQIRGLLTYVRQKFVKEKPRQLKERDLPDANPVALNADSSGRGEQIFQLRCTGCHGKKADGKGPNSLDILPRPRNLRNAEFLKATPDRRLFESILYGVQGRAMPPWIDYGLTKSNVGDLINYLRSLNSSLDKLISTRRLDERLHQRL